MLTTKTLRRVDTDILSRILSRGVISTYALSQHVVEIYQKLVEDLPSQYVVRELSKIFIPEMNWLAIMIKDYFFNEVLFN
jgi:hypothetical protein